MSASFLFDNFQVVTRSPSGMQHVRHAIRQLAIRGRLTTQSLDDGHANQFLKEVEAYKATANESSTSQRRRSNDESTQVMPYPLPPNWTWAPLGDVVVNRDSERVPLSKAIRSIQKVKRFDYYGASGVIDQVEDFIFEKSLLLIGEDGANLINRATPIAFIAHGKYWVNNHAHVLDGISLDLLRYLELFINSISLEPYVTGTAQPKMNQAKMRRIPVAIPPAEEQKRIVAKVDELMGLCDRLESQLAERAKLLPLLSRANHARFIDEPTEENLKAIFHEVGSLSVEEIRETIISMGVFGALTSRYESNQTSSELLSDLRERQAEMHAQVVGRARKTISGLVAPNWSTNIPSSWELAQVDDVVVVTSGVTKGRHLTGRKTITLHYLRVANVQRWHLLLDQVKEIEVLEEDLEKYRLIRGDVVMIEGGDWDKLGRAAIWNEEIKDCIHQNHIFRIRSPDQKLLLPEWIVLFVNSRIGRSYFESCSKQTTNLASINMTQLRACPLPLPPPTEQREIVNHVQRLLEVVEKLEGVVAEAATVAELFAEAAVSRLTGLEQVEDRSMKPPAIEIVTSLKKKRKPPQTVDAPLARLLADGSLTAKSLWLRSGLEIDRFYAQLKAEIANGWIADPQPATVKEVEVS